MQRLELISPGDILRVEFLEALEISQTKLAGDLNIPASRINDIVKGRRAITADTALRLSAYFGTTPQFWLNLQNNYDLESLERAGSVEHIKAEIRANPAIGLIN